MKDNQIILSSVTLEDLASMLETRLRQFRTRHLGEGKFIEVVHECPHTNTSIDNDPDSETYIEQCDGCGAVYNRLEELWND